MRKVVSMSLNSQAFCERCGNEEAGPHDIIVFTSEDTTDRTDTETVAYFLCDACADFLRARAPVYSSEVVDESAMVADLASIRRTVQDVSHMQNEIDRLRGQITNKKTNLRYAIRQMCGTISEEQWRRLIQAEKMKGETSLIFWLEKYRAKK
jgi:hypothetical protein